MKQVPDSLLAFQHMFPDDDACAAWLIEMRWPDGFVCPACGHEKGWALRRKAHTFECAGCRPADLGDGRDDPARQQAAAHRLVLGRLPDGDPLQRHLCPAAPETARYRLLPQRLAARPQAARQHGRPRAQPVVGPGGNRRGQPSIPDQRRSSHRRARTQPRRQDAHRRRHRTRGRKHPRPPAAGRNLLLRRRRPRTLRRNRRRSRRHRENRRLVRATLRSPPIATMSMSSGRPPLTSSCRGSTKSSPTSKDGREASTTGCVASICRPISMSSSFASTAAKPATLLSARSSASPPMQNPLPTAC